MDECYWIQGGCLHVVWVHVSSAIWHLLGGQHNSPQYGMTRGNMLCWWYSLINVWDWILLVRVGYGYWVESSLLCCTKYDVYPSLECVNGEWLFHPIYEYFFQIWVWIIFLDFSMKFFLCWMEPWRFISHFLKEGKGKTKSKGHYGLSETLKGKYPFYGSNLVPER